MPKYTSAQYYGSALNNKPGVSNSPAANASGPVPPATAGNPAQAWLVFVVVLVAIRVLWTMAD